MDQENLGATDRIVNTVLQYTDHMVHNRPGMNVRDGSAVGVRWTPVKHQEIEGRKVVFSLTKVGKKTNKTKIGYLRDDGQIVAENDTVIGKYQPAGIFPEVAVWMYRQVSEVWKLDNEFAARWASYSFGQEHRDLKVVLAAFMLVQSRKGDPVMVDGKQAFQDQDYRDIGEAMLLLQRKDGKDFNPKLLLRIRTLLSLPEIAEINRNLGFCQTARRAPLGRWNKAVHKWLQYREQNPKMLEGLVKAGFSRTVIELACQSGYKPESPRFFQILRWEQKQSNDGHRSIAIGDAVRAAESWDGLSEEQVCERIVRDKPGFKRLAGLVPKGMGLTRAILAAAIDIGALSHKDLVILSPTLEEVGLLNVPEYRAKWDTARKSMEDMRAANLALRMKSKETREALEETADTALKNAVAEVMKDIRIYFCVDRSSSMTTGIEQAKTYVAKFLQGFPPERVHVSAFNQVGREIKIPHASAAGVANAFTGMTASGGTDYAQGLYALRQYVPKPEEDVLCIFVGDEEAHEFSAYVRQSGLRPMAFGLVRIGNSPHRCVQVTAAQLGIPCFMIDEKTFEDPYAIPRAIRALVAATPVSPLGIAVAAPKRVSLVETILQTDLLEKPAWAA